MGRSSDTSCIICGCWCGEGRQICFSCEQDINAGRILISRKDPKDIDAMISRIKCCIDAGDCPECEMNAKTGCSFDTLLQSTLDCLQSFKK